MKDASSDRRFGMAWLFFALAFAVHFTDEATHDFLSVYNPNVAAIRARFPFLPLPTFTFAYWLGLLVAGFFVLLCLAPFAFRGSRLLRALSWPLGILVGILNACLHMAVSVYFHRWMPGVYSAPLLLVAAVYLLATSRPRAVRHES